MNCNKNKAFSLIELIVSLFLLSVLLIFIMRFYQSIHEKNTQTLEHEVLKLEILNTKLFLEKNPHLQYLSLKEDELFFNDSLLLKDVSTFELEQKNNYFKIKLCIKQTICQTMMIEQ